MSGVSDVLPGTEIILRILNLTGHTDIRVALGASIPLQRGNSFPEIWQPPVDKALGLPFSKHNLKPAPTWADSLIARIAETCDNDLTILALESMTNIASSLNNYSDLPEKINQIIVKESTQPKVRIYLKRYQKKFDNLFIKAAFCKEM